MTIFGMSLSEIFMVGGAVLSSIWGFFRLSNLVSENKESLDRLKEDLSSTKTDLYRRIDPLETDTKTHNANVAALTATLMATQNSLQSLSTDIRALSSRIDHTITIIKEDK